MLNIWKLVRIWILISWCFLTVGILLGSWWAYHELGWGGWWFWDPVENASLMPWLLATACIHSITRTFRPEGPLRSEPTGEKDRFNWETWRTADKNHRAAYVSRIFPSTNGQKVHLPLFPKALSKAVLLCALGKPTNYRALAHPGLRGSSPLGRVIFDSKNFLKDRQTSTLHPSGLIYWTVICTQSTFIFSILGTFFVRSGLLSSVHSFATDSTRGLYLFIFLLFITTISVLNWILLRHNNIVVPLSKVFPLLRPLAVKNGIDVKDSNSAVVKVTRIKQFNRSIEQILYLQNFYLCVICIVIFFGTSSPIFYQWFWNKDVGTGAPFYNGTLIPLFTSVFFVLVYVHFLQFDRSNSFHDIQTTSQYKLNLIRSKPSVLTNINWSIGPKTRRTNFQQFKIRFFEPLLRIEDYSTQRRGSSPLGRVIFDSKKFDFLTKTGSTFFQTVVKKLVQAKYVTDHRLVPFLPGRVARPQPEAQSSSSKGVSYNNNLIHNNMLYVYCILFYIFHVFCLHFFIKLDLLNSIYGAFCFLLISNIFLLEKKNIFRNFNKKSEKANIYRQGPRAKTLQHQATLKKLDDFKIQNAPTSLEMKIAHSGLVLFISGILLSNTFKFQFTEQLHSGSMIRLGPKTICCLRSIDHSFAPTFHSICANLLVFESNESDIFTNGVLSTAYGLRQVDQKLEGPKGNFVGQQTIESNLDTPLFNPSMPVLLGTKLQAYYNKHNSFLTSLIEKVPLLGVEQSSNQKTETELSIFTIRPLLCLFPEKRFYFSNSELTTTKVAIHSNLFTDVYGLVGTGSFESGWFTTIMKLPFIFCIWLGFMFAVLGGAIAIKKQLQKSKVIWH